MRALHHLSGGNHRVYIVLSQFIDRESLDELIGPFEKMLDELTPYYQERLRWLSPQQRKIVEFLCTCPSPASVSLIAQRLFITNQTAASQLKVLRENGYVLCHSRGRESLYELTEPLIRLSYEIKQNGYQPIRLIVDFLRIWYNPDELRDPLKRLPSEALRERKSLNAAINIAAIDDPQVSAIAADIEKAIKEGFELLESHRFAKLAPDDRRLLKCATSMIGSILRSSLDAHKWKERVERLIVIFDKLDKLNYFGENMVNSLMDIDAKMLSREALDAWRKIWLEAGANRPDLQFGLKLFDVGMKYLMTGDRRVLFDLLSTERSIVCEALGITEEE